MHHAERAPIVVAVSACLLACVLAAPSRAERAFLFEEGVASWYGGKFHGRPTASGERFDEDELTAAHRTLPFGTILLVTNVESGAATRVRINDRGPFVKGRVLDCSKAAAEELGFRGAGLARVRLEILGRLPDADDPRLSKRQRKRLSKALRRASRRGRPLDSEAIDEVLVAVDPERGPFAVQVGAFAVEANARRLARALSEAGWPSFTWAGPDDLLRVRVGPQPDRAAAERVEARLQAAGHPTFIVRVD